jgi:hypothetical protein
MRGEEPDVSEEHITSGFIVKNVIPGGNRQKQNQISFSYLNTGAQGQRRPDRPIKREFHFMPFAFMGPCISDIVCTKKEK